MIRAMMAEMFSTLLSLVDGRGGARRQSYRYDCLDRRGAADSGEIKMYSLTCAVWYLKHFEDRTSLIVSVDGRELYRDPGCVREPTT